MRGSLEEANLVIVDCAASEKLENISQIEKAMTKLGFELLGSDFDSRKSMIRQNREAIYKAEISRHSGKKYFIIARRHVLFPEKQAGNWVDRRLRDSCDCYLFRKDWMKLIEVNSNAKKNQAR